MNVQKGTAAHLGQQAAGKKEFQYTLYDKAAPKSSNLKQEIGELLFCLEFPVGKELSQVGWELFERLLRRYIDLRVLPQSVSVQPESTKSSQRVVG